MTCLAAFLVDGGLPETSRHGHLHQEAELFLRVSQLHPVAQVLAGLAPVVAVAAKPVRQPHRTNIDEAKGQLRTLADAGLIDIGNIIQHLDVLHDFLDLIIGQMIRLAVEPERHVSQRTATKRIALTTADEGLTQFLRLVRLFISMCTLPLALLLGIELFLGTYQLAQAVDVFRRLHTCREVLEAEAFIRIQRLIDLVELYLFLLCTIR